MPIQPPQLQSLDEYRARFSSIQYWQPYVEIVCERHHLIPCHNARCHNPGTYPTFIVDDHWVVKFFGELFNGPANYATELDANLLVAGDRQIAAPALLAQGNLLGPSEGWRWPYLIFEYLPGVSLGDVFDEITLEDKLTVARQLGALTRHLRHLHLDNAAVLRPDASTYTDMLRELHPACAQRQRQWHTLPDHLLAQVESYILPLDALLAGARSPALLHADITGDHLLGKLEAGHWTMQGLIDFGDAIVGDPAYELIPLHLDAFHCDKRLLDAYLTAYGILPSERQALIRRAMSLSLLFQFNIFGGVFGLFPQASQVETLDELAARLWDPDAPALCVEE